MPTFAPQHTLLLGEARVTFLADGGGIINPLATFPNSTEESWREHQDLLDEAGKFITSIGGVLIELGDRTIVVDSGIGPQTVDFPGFGPFQGAHFLQSLEQAGARPEAVTDLIFTHLHLDHCGWISHEHEGERHLRFPNAQHQCTKQEWDTWYGGDHPAGPDPDQAQKPLADRITFFQEGDELAPGLIAISSPGHTPGHASLALTSAGERLYLLGDIVHAAAQLQEVDWTFALDFDAKTARQSREHMLGLAADEQAWIAACHFSNQVFGRVSRHREGWHWHPLET